MCLDFAKGSSSEYDNATILDQYNKQLAAERALLSTDPVASRRAAQDMALVAGMLAAAGVANRMKK